MNLLSELSDLNEQLLLLDGDNQLKDAELILKGQFLNKMNLINHILVFPWLENEVELAKL